MMNLNINPYFDNADDAIAKNYHKILFVPGNPVQARELTQIQSILQNQIKMHGDHIFQNGTMVIPGNVYYDSNIPYVNLNAVYNGQNTDSIIDSLVGTTLTGSINGLTARVVNVEKSTTTTEPIAYIKYLSANGTVKTFNKEEILTNSLSSVIVSSATNYSGTGAVCHIGQGVFYINGYFIGVDNQVIAISTSNNETCSVGLSLVEKIVTANDDPTLYDNALGFSNYSAPGADRYQIQLILTKLTTDTIDPTSFIKLIDVSNGVLQTLNNNTQYAEIDKMLARRSYDTNGNFIVSTDIPIKAYNKRSNSRKEWVANTYYMRGDVVTYTNISTGIIYSYYATAAGFSGSTQPTHIDGTSSDGSINWIRVYKPILNSGVSTADTTKDQAISDDAKYKLSVGPVHAYINGFEVNTNTVSLDVPKTRSTNTIKNYIPLNTGRYLVVTNISGSLAIDVLTPINIKDHSAVTIGTAFARSIEYVSGTQGASGIYNLHIVGLKMYPGYNFYDNAASVTYSSTFSCDIQPTLVLLGSNVTNDGGDNTKLNAVGTIAFDMLLSVGSKVKVGATTASVQAIVTSVQIDTDTAFTVTNQPIYKMVATYENSNPSNYIMNLPNSPINSVRNNSGEMDITYTIVKRIDFTSVGATSVTSTALGTNDYFVNTQSHVLLHSTDAPINSSFVLSSGNKQITINGLTIGHSYTLCAIVLRTADLSKEKTKTLTTKSIVVDTTGTYLADTYVDHTNRGALISTSTLASPNILLTEADVLSVLSVKQSSSQTDYVEAGAVDIGNRFTYDSNVTEDYYGISFLTDPSHTVSVVTPLKITFTYFEHSSGDFFTKNSYSTTPDEYLYTMAESLDFRPRIADNGVDFTSTGASVSPALYTASSVALTYSFFLHRLDLICVTDTGSVVYITGTPGVYPTIDLKFPAMPANALLLAKCFVSANIAKPEYQFFFTFEKYQRYTMNDIARIDSRLANVEKYVQLSLLEKTTNDMQVLDENGLTRF